MPTRFRFLRFATTWKFSPIRPDRPAGKLNEPRELATELDGWACRDEFFRLPREKKAYLDFLNKVGLWNESDTDLKTGLTLAPSFEEDRAPGFLASSDVWSFRDEMQRALMQPKRFIAMYAHGKHAWPIGLLKFDLAGKVPVLTIETRCFRHLLIVTICADLARGLRFQECKRKDCGFPFPIETAHKRKYCSQYCGHLESVRRQRRIAKKAKGAKQ